MRRSYALVTVEPPSATLWVDPQKLDDAVLGHLTELATLQPYNGAVSEVVELLSVNNISDAWALRCRRCVKP